LLCLFTAAATPDPSTLSLHDALPIWSARPSKAYDTRAGWAAGRLVASASGLEAFEALQVPRQGVDLEVDLGPLGHFAERRDFGRVRDHVEAEVDRAILAVVDFVHRQRDAIDGDRTLRGDERRQLCRRADRETSGGAFRLPIGDPADRIDVARDDVAAHLVAELERGLEIDAAAFAPHAPGGARDRLGRDIHSEPGALRAVLRLPKRAAIDHGQAYARAGDRSADGDCVRIEWAGDRHVQVAAWFDLADGADGGDDASEHSGPFVAFGVVDFEAVAAKLAPVGQAPTCRRTRWARFAERGNAHAEARRRAIEQQAVNEAGSEECFAGGGTAFDEQVLQAER